MILKNKMLIWFKESHVMNKSNLKRMKLLHEKIKGLVDFDVDDNEEELNPDEKETVCISYHLKLHILQR